MTPVEADQLDRGEWIFSSDPSRDGVEIELRVHGHRFVGLLRVGEEDGWERVVEAISEALNSGRSRVDVNEACVGALGRSMFTPHTPTPFRWRRLFTGA